MPLPVSSNEPASHSADADTIDGGPQVPVPPCDIDAAPGTTSVNRVLEQKLENLRRSFIDDVRAAPKKQLDRGREHLLLRVKDELYALAVDDTLEIVTVPPIIPVPHSEPAILGIINFRGQVASVTSLRRLLGQTDGVADSANRIVVLRGPGEPAGLFVDAVDGLLHLRTDRLEPVPTPLGDRMQRLLIGQACWRDGIVSALDIEQIRPRRSLGAGR